MRVMRPHVTEVSIRDPIHVELQFIDQGRPTATFKAASMPTVPPKLLIRALGGRSHT